MAIHGKGKLAPIAPLVPLAPVETDGTSAKALDAAPLEGTIEPLELIKIDPANALELFTVEGALTPILERVAQEVRSLVLDASTPKGREEIISVAFKIGKVKNYLEEQGVALNRKLKEQPKLVDKNKKAAWDFLEGLQKDTRRPVTEWEAEQARIEAEKKAAEEAAALARQVEADHEIALTLNWAYDQKKQEEFEALERAVHEREEQIAREAAEKERLDSIQREADLKAAAEKAEREKAEAEQRQRDAEAREAQAKIDAEAARVKAQKEADERAEQAAIEAAQQERDRQAAAKKAEDDATAARTKDREHRQKFNQEALADLTKMTGISEEQAKAVIGGIAMGKVRHISISY